MYLRLVQFNLGSNARPTAERIARRVIPLIRTQPGCQRAEFFAEDTTGNYGIVVLWATRSDADAAAKVVSPVLTESLVAANATSEQRNLFEVLESAA